MTTTTASTSEPAAASPRPVDLRRFYAAKPYSQDPTVLVPDGVPDDVPLHTLTPIDAPAVVRPSDLADPKRPRLRFFTRGQYRTILAFAEALIAPPEGTERAITPAEIAINVDRYVACSDSRMRIFIRSAIILLNLRPLASFQLPFRLLSLAARRRFCARFETNKGLILPQLARLKSLVYMGYYGDPRTNALTAYTQVFDREPPLFAASRAHLRRLTWDQPDPLLPHDDSAAAAAASPGTPSEDS